MAMRFNGYTGAVALVAAALPFSACFDTQQTCEDLANCPEGRAGTGGGASGTGGSTGARGGSSARAGTSGAGGGASGAPNAGGSAGQGGTGAGGGAGDGGESGVGGAGTGGALCDATQAPGEDSCVISEEYGVFVSAAGDDAAGNGSRAKPFATLSKAIEQASKKDKRVYACADGGRYEESLELDAAANGLELYGGFACDDWSYSTSAQSRLSSKTALALHVDGVNGLRVEDFRIQAADATAPGESSVGVFVASSTKVVFRRVRIEAGAGMAGENGTREDFVFPEREELDGNSASDGTGADPKVCECPGGTATSGGSGGDAQIGGQNGGNGAPAHGTAGGAGGDAAASSCSVGGGGSNGASAPAPTPAAGASKVGSLTSAGWTPASGSDGAVGAAGQGGGGGASSTTGGGGGGGGGGCGGCGGAGGKGGQGGGGSIGLAAFESEVALEDAVLLTGHAGDGGKGIRGQTGQTEAGFAGDRTLNGCDGGAGGLGGDGAASGGGAGGISVGILWSGSMAPTQHNVSITTGASGAEGTGGDPVINDGVPGEVHKVLKAP